MMLIKCVFFAIALSGIIIQLAHAISCPSSCPAILNAENEPTDCCGPGSDDECGSCKSSACEGNNLDKCSDDCETTGCTFFPASSTCDSQCWGVLGGSCKAANDILICDGSSENCVPSQGHVCNQYNPNNPPVGQPTFAPTFPPSKAPTVPSMVPTVPPSKAPIVPPSKAPTVPPSKVPTVPPSKVPTLTPFQAPTMTPSTKPNSNQSPPAVPGPPPINPPPRPPRPSTDTNTTVLTLTNTTGAHTSNPGNGWIIFVSCGGAVFAGLIGLFAILKYNWQMPTETKYEKTSLNAFDAEINSLNQQDTEAAHFRNGD